MRRLLAFLLLILLAACAAAPPATLPQTETINLTATATAVGLPATAAALPATAVGLPATTTATPAPATATVPPATATPLPESSGAGCSPAPIIRPTLPAKIPGSTQLDTTTNLHVTGIYQLIDPVSYRLKVTGKVDHPLSLSLDELRCMPRVTDTPTLVCPNTFEDTATWSGVPLAYLLDQAGVQNDAQKVVLIGADDYKVNLSLKEARSPDAFLAYYWRGQPLPVLHGFPLRAVLPSLIGGRWVKWLVEIEVQ